MSTTIANSEVGSVTRPAGAVLRRFVWKEFRMFRGLWLAVVVMGAIMQCALNLLMPPSVDHATMLFSTALAAAVLYAVGAAATTFSVEHEEETYGFLAGLPTQWWPIYAGKLLVVIVNAALVTAVLSIVGWLLCGFNTPGGRDTPVSLAIFGIAIVEATAWGTLFSVLVKRPLVAAILTLVVGGAAVNVAVNASSNYAVASTVPQAYLDAIPARLAIIALVSACSALAGRRWIGAAPRPTRAVRSRPMDGWSLLRQALTKPTSRVADVAARGARRRMLARLLWQTWRESWKLLPLPVLVAIVLWLGIAAVIGLGALGDEPTGLAIMASLHFVPALFGAMTFHIDQRRGSYRFLAEHAARPRYVWLARHIVWLGALASLYVVAASIIALLAANVFTRDMQDTLSRYLRNGQSAIYTNAANMTYEWVQGANYSYLALGLASTGLLAAYAIGQLCSMLLRSEILAAFIAVVLSTVLSAWVAALFAWQLSGWLLLLPLAAGLFAATWLRAPDWIAGRNRWRAWLKPVAAIAASLVVLGVLLPPLRLAQLPPSVSQAAAWIHEINSVPDAARQTADDYIKAAERFAAGPKENLLARWETSDRRWSPGVALEGVIPADEMDEFLDADRGQRALLVANVNEAVDAAMELSKRPVCLFDFNLSQIALHPASAAQELSLNSYRPYTQLTGLMKNLLYAPEVERSLAAGDDGPAKATAATYTAVDRALAALRMSVHLRTSQPSVVFIDQLRTEREISGYIASWAQQEGRTEEELRDALARLQEYFNTAGHSIDATLALQGDDWLVRQVIAGDEPSLALALQPDSLPVHLALLANQLPWERERALRALDRITNYNLQRAQHVNWNTPQEAWMMAEPAAATSYLARYEYLARNSMRALRRAEMDAETYRRATLLRIALALYRLEHGEYPPRLASLAPEYLPHDSLVDPYTSQLFQYEPGGLELPLDQWGWQARIEPNTPFFWSVGPADLQIMQGENIVHDPADEGGEGRVEQRYMLMIDNWQNWYPSDTLLVFPLAKPESEE